MFNCTRIAILLKTIFRHQVSLGGLNTIGVHYKLRKID